MLPCPTKMKAQLYVENTGREFGKIVVVVGGNTRGFQPFILASSTIDNGDSTLVEVYKVSFTHHE